MSRPGWLCLCRCGGGPFEADKERYYGEGQSLMIWTGFPRRPVSVQTDRGRRPERLGTLSAAQGPGGR